MKHKWAKTGNIADVCEVCGQPRGPRDENAVCWKAEIVALESRLASSSQEAARLREALKFYADKSNWAPDCMGDTSVPGGFQSIPSAIERDDGERARAALEGAPNER